MEVVMIITTAPVIMQGLIGIIQLVRQEIFRAVKMVVNTIITLIIPFITGNKLFSFCKNAKGWYSYSINYYGKYKLTVYLQRAENSK